MDFRSIISTAQQNVSTSKTKANFYSTKFEPPKKLTKEKKLSAGIQKFLEQKQREDEEKAEQARQKKLDLVARRDPKIQRKIEKTLKTLKSSRKFHNADRTLDENEAIALQNLQPDEDDYGYTSNISDEIHRKLMEKYKNLPEEKKFSSVSGKHKAMSKEEIQRAKDRMKNALNSNEDDHHHFNPGPKQRTSKIKSEKEVSKSAPVVEKKQDKPKPKIRPAPIVDFQQLLKLAEQKQHEDITIDVPSKKEPERLLTSKEKREQEELEAMKKARMKPKLPSIPKLGAIPKIGDSSKHDKNNNESSAKKTPATGKPNAAAAVSRPDPKAPEKFKKPSVSSSSNPSSKLRDALQKNGTVTQRPSGSSTSSSSNHKVPSSSSLVKPGSSSGKPTKSISNGKPTPSSSSSVASSSKPRPSTSSKGPEKSREFPPKDLMRSREFPPKDLMRSREFPPKDLMRSREFPPKDLMRSREFPPRDLKRPKQQPLQVSKKRRIEDEDSEYDSELDDFIDDGDEDLDYSSEIKKIFGYDKSRYRDEDFDDSMMESDYRTVMREEFISKKIGLMEDLEDMKMEAEEIARKKAKKARRL